MIIQLLFELVLTALIILIAVTQIIKPLFAGRPIFPYFRRKNLVHELEKSNEELDQEKIRKDIKDIQKQKDKL